MNPSTANDPLASAPTPSTRPGPELGRDAAPDFASRGMMRICVILPAYNEEQNLEQLLKRIREALEPLDYLYEVVVVNDGSRDKTADIAKTMSESMPIQLENHKVNQGLGATLRTGFLAALKQADPNDVLVSMDADNTQPPESIPAMVAMIQKGYDIVVASRFQPGSKVVGLSWSRRLMSTGARLVFSTVLPIPGIRDYTSGFRAYRASILQRGLVQFGDRFFSETGFSSMADILLKLRKQKPVAGEIPLVLRYDQKQGASKMKVLKTIWATLGLVARRKLR